MAHKSLLSVENARRRHCNKCDQPMDWSISKGIERIRCEGCGYEDEFPTELETVKRIGAAGLKVAKVLNGLWG